MSQSSNQRAPSAKATEWQIAQSINLVDEFAVVLEQGVQGLQTRMLLSSAIQRYKSRPCDLSYIRRACLDEHEDFSRLWLGKVGFQRILWGRIDRPSRIRARMPAQ